VDCLFLDVNILFSAAYHPEAGLRRLWTFADVCLLTSSYALEEVRINLPEPAQRARLGALVAQVQLVNDVRLHALPAGIDLPQKDQPILLAAMAAQATHLLTGDLRDFGPYFGQTVAGVLILPPAAYFRCRANETRR
jgi:uncharacterized protein